MKNVYRCSISFFFILIFSTFSYSQVTFGVKSGINIATTKDLITFPKNRLGWYGGGLIQIPFHQNLFFQPEIIYSSKGYRYIDLSDEKTVAMRLNYLSLPILIGYKIDHKTNIILGVDFDFLAKATNYFNNENFDATSSFPHRFDAGLDVGVSYKFTKNWGAEIRYNYGFKDFYQTDASGNRKSEFTAANRVFQIGAYFTFHK